MVVKNIITILAGIAVIVGVVAVIMDETAPDLDQVKKNMEPLQTTASAEAAGYRNVDVERCVSSPEGTMGYHFVNFNLLDIELDPSKPEILVFVPGDNGELRLAAVEYAVPIDEWDEGSIVPPRIFGQVLHVNAELGLYVLHAWIYEENPAGVFADWNPDVSCVAILPDFDQSEFATGLGYSNFNIN
jgi:hypothetical protein